MQFCIIYHNLDNDNVGAKFTRLHYKLQFNCLASLKSIAIKVSHN
jgi:hypothetical protein